MFSFRRRPRHTVTEIRTRYLTPTVEELGGITIRDAVNRLRAEYADIAVDVEPDIGSGLPHVPYKLGAMNGLVTAAAAISGKDTISLGFQFDKYASLRRQIARELAEHKAAAALV